MRSSETTGLREAITLFVCVNMLCDVCLVVTKLVADVFLIQTCMVVMTPFSDLPQCLRAKANQDDRALSLPWLAVTLPFPHPHLVPKVYYSLYPMP